MAAKAKKIRNVTNAKERAAAKSAPAEGRAEQPSGKGGKALYYHERLGITFRIIGLLFEDDRYEIYHASNKKYDRNIILHFRRTDGPRKFNVRKVDFERVTAGAQPKPPREVNLPWDNKSDRLKGH
ncbi:MAG: hypothetical protein KJ002_11380 [Candidatus Dadabacteria bacterium]|jgi:hypothetical protein|nr:hypothetical protein [Candidatus Dadabacteria bacterium]